MNKELTAINFLFPNLLEGDESEIDCDILLSLDQEAISALLSNKSFYQLFDDLITGAPELIDRLPKDLIDEPTALLAIKGMVYGRNNLDCYWDEIFSAIKIPLKKNPFFIKQIVSIYNQHGNSWLNITSLGFRLISSVSLEVWKDKDTAFSLLKIGADCFGPLNTKKQERNNSLLGDHHGIYGNDGMYYHWSSFVKINTLKDILNRNGYLKKDDFYELFLIIESAIQQNLHNLQTSSTVDIDMTTWIEDEDLFDYKFS